MDQRDRGVLAEDRGSLSVGRLPDARLVFVRCGLEHYALAEWVYNEADIDAAKVVWAHDMGAAANGELMRYFRDRQAWVVEADGAGSAVRPPPALLGHKE